MDSEEVDEAHEACMEVVVPFMLEDYRRRMEAGRKSHEGTHKDYKR